MNRDPIAALERHYDSQRVESSAEFEPKLADALTHIATEPDPRAAIDAAMRGARRAAARARESLRPAPESRPATTPT